jgi:hypothetical protein
LWVEIDTRSGEFSYNAVYFSGERRRGSLLFEIPSGAHLTEIVLVPG